MPGLAILTGLWSTLKRLPWGVIGALLLVVGLIVGAGRIESDAYHCGIAAERARWTVKQAEAAADDARRVVATERAQGAITAEKSHDYQADLVALRVRYGRLLAASKADPGGGSRAAVPGVPDAAGGPDGAAAQAGLPPEDALTASEQAYQLKRLQEWVAAQQTVARD